MGGNFSPEEICSAALALLGQNPISDIESTNPHAVLCKSVFAITRDALLETYNWAFATKRQTLVQLFDAPDFGPAYQFQLPADCLRVQNPHDARITYSIESDRLLSDYSEVGILYTRRVEESGYMSSLFVNALAANIALKLAMPILKKASAVQLAVGFFQDAILAAKRADAMQERPDDSSAEEKSLWLEAR